MRRSIVRAVWSKELLDAARDPRAALYFVGLPLVFYPLLLLALEYITQRAIEPTLPTVTPVPMARVESLPSVVHALSSQGAGESGGGELLVIPSVSPSLDVASGNAPIGIEPIGLAHDEVETGEPGQRLRLDIYVNRAVPGADAARDLVLAALEPFRDRYQISEIPLGKTPRNVAMMTALYPYFLVVIILVGAAHMAIDITAGEKERRTLETLLVAPARRLHVFIGKTAATFTAATVAGGLGMLGFWLATLVADLLTGGRAQLLSLPPDAFAVLGLGAFPVAFFLSTLLLTLGTVARSSREGQTYAAYLQMPLLLLALVVTYVGADSRSYLYLVPLLGTNLVQAEYLSGDGSAVHAVTASVSTLVFGLALSLVSVRLFGKESVLFRQ